MLKHEVCYTTQMAKEVVGNY